MNKEQIEALLSSLQEKEIELQTLIDTYNEESNEALNQSSLRLRESIMWLEDFILLKFTQYKKGEE